MPSEAQGRVAYTLTLSCFNRPGIVAAIGQLLFDLGMNITEAQQFDDTESRHFFMRVVFGPVDPDAVSDVPRAALAGLAERFGMDWTLKDNRTRTKVLLMVSKFDHCLVDLLYR
ncbi:ACT domain-containing protein, partial [Gluconacetobacter tumulisoli]|nr:ACT domain-containing protein [Gluconacetobacter tumulisoli]